MANALDRVKAAEAKYTAMAETAEKLESTLKNFKGTADLCSCRVVQGGASMTGRLRFLSGWTCALLLTGFPAQVGHSQTLPEQLSADTVMSFIEANDIGSAADLIESLPRLHKRHVAFVFDSEAIQPELVSREHPRVVSWGADARFILSWASNPDAPDLVEFLEQGTTQWDAGVIDFSGDEAELSNPEVCSTCHGHLNKPIWGSYEAWLGTDGSRDLRGRDVYSPCRGPAIQNSPVGVD